MKTPEHISVEESFRYCRSLAYKHAKTFYFASYFLPKEKRNACYAIYAFCRTIDDIVDASPNTLDHEKLASTSLDTWRSLLSGSSSTSSEIVPAWNKTVLQYSLDPSLAAELIDGVAMDLTVKRYKRYQDLLGYCYKVASVVGLLTKNIYGGHSDEATKYAVDLGLAMQLTNIIRDVGEDAERGRIYLAREDILRFGLSEDSILRRERNPSTIQLLKEYMNRADKLYESANRGIPLLDRDSQLTVQLMSTNYQQILRCIERNEYQVFDKRASVSFFGKILGVLSSQKALQRNRRITSTHVLTS